MPGPPIIQLHRVSKRFGGVVALDQVSFEIVPGEVHAVAGENGAGKSTLMKLLAGVHEPDEGDIHIDGRPVRLKNPREAHRQGISIVFQELSLFPSRSVTANVFANRELSFWGGWVNRRSMREATRDVLSEMGVHLSPDTLVGQLTIGERQIVEIARTSHQRSRIIILDEPNSALNEAESQRLFDIVRRLRERGLTIVYVSHRLEEIFAIADRITVMRDGRYQGTFVIAQTSIPQIIASMIGRPMENSFPERPPNSGPGPITLQVRDLRAGERLGPVSFKARAGEILGLAGVEGSGIDELFHALFGLLPIAAGEILLEEERQFAGSSREAIRKGLALIPESRREQGLMMEWPVGRNATLLILENLLNRIGLIDRAAIRSTCDRYLRPLRIVSAGIEQKVSTLSGGNQQKVLLGKWLAINPSILILNDPTRGVDVGAKWEIYELCQKLASEGMTILMTSSEIEEILGLSDRVLVFRKGTVLHEFERGQVRKAQLMHAMAGAVVSI